MKDNRLKGIIALAVVTVIAFGVIYGSKALTKDDSNNNNNQVDNNDNQNVPGAIAVGDEKGIKSAREITDDSGNVTGYVVTSSARGFIGEIVLEVTYDKDAKTIQSVSVVNQTETPDYGGKMTNPDFLAQFNGITAPITMDKSAAASADNTDTDNTDAAAGTLHDGVYVAKADEADNGYLSEVTLVVEGGQITSVVWDAKDSKGQYKSYLSTAGKYVMTEDGLTWKEQADALAAYVIENHSIEGINLDENGKTDTVAGVSISIDRFTSLVEEALQMAATGSGDTDSKPVSEGPSYVDAISGATVSSDAIVEAINRGYDFISSYAK